MIDGFVEAARSAGLKPEGIDLNAFALMRALGTDESASRPPACSATSPRVVNLAIAVGDLCVFTRPLSATWGGDQEDVASTLADEIRLSIDSYMGQPDAPRRRRGRALRPRARPTRRSSRSSACCCGCRSRSPRRWARSTTRRMPPGDDPAPLHGRHRPGARGGGVKPVNLLPGEYRPRAGEPAPCRAAPTCWSACWPALVLLVGALRLHREQGHLARERDGRGQGSRPRPPRPRSPRSAPTATSPPWPSSAARRSSSWPQGASTGSASSASWPRVLPTACGSPRSTPRSRPRARPAQRPPPTTGDAADQPVPRPSSPAAPRTSPTWPS